MAFLRTGKTKPRELPPKRGVPGVERSSTSVYERERTTTEVTVKSQGARLSRDKVLQLMGDERFHSANELSKHADLKPGDWYVCIRELIDYGYAFGRRCNSLIIRRRLLSEKPQELSELLAGIDPTIVEDVNAEHQHAAAMDAVRRRQGLPVALEGPRERWAPDEHSPDEPHGLPEPGSDFDPGEDVVKLPADVDRLILSVDKAACVLPAKASITSTFAILARKRSGKTYLAMVMAEEMLRRGLPIIIIDPTGAWYGLRGLVNGTPSPWGILTLGGKHGHFKLEADMGNAVARLAMRMWPRPILLDVSDLLPEDQHQFVADFGNRLFLENSKAVHVFVDEADEYAPQQVDTSSKHHRRCLGVMDRLTRRGGVKGIGITHITQRAAVLHKNVLTQVLGIFVLSMAAPQDLDQVETWMKSGIAPTDIAACRATIPKLRQGEAYHMQSTSRQWGLVKMMVRPKETYDSSKTPTVDDPEPAVPELANPDSETMAMAVEILGIDGPEDVSGDDSDGGA